MGTSYEEPVAPMSGAGHVLVLGAGAIGSSWVRLALAAGVPRVTVVDPDAAARERLTRDASLAAAFGAERLSVSSGIESVSADVNVVIEAAPENPQLKRRIIADTERHLSPDAIIVSSTSGITATALQSEMRVPERMLVAHPFNPPHLVPLVEIIGGERTAPEVVDSVIALFTAWGKKPVRLSAELEGHVANRLQAALWKEAYYLVTEGLATVEEVDAVMAHGPGLRWALLGPFATQHLSGGPGGFRHLIDHLGDAQSAMWNAQQPPVMSAENTEALVSQVESAYGGTEVDLLRRRDSALAAIIDAREQFGF